MELIPNRRSTMTLFTTESGIEGHACRIALHEKQVECEVEIVDQKTQSELLGEINPYGESPTLVDRELVLYGSHIIAEYLDDRLPHPPLMPPDPINRGRARLMIYRFQREWLVKLNKLEPTGRRPGKKLRNKLRQDLLAFSPYLGGQDFMLGHEFSLVDCFMAPVLWRLDYYKITLPKQTKEMKAYQQRIFARESFAKSLTKTEKEMQ